MRSIYTTLVAVGLLLCVFSPVEAQDPSMGAKNWDLVGAPAGTPVSGAELEALTEEVAGIMRCPVCQGLSIADSPTALAQAMKSEVKEMLAEGYSKGQVLDYFEQSYGEFIRLEPKAKGFNLLVWIAPLVVLVGGLLFLSTRMKRKASSDSRKVDDATEASPESELETYRARVRREVGL